MLQWLSDSGAPHFAALDACCVAGLLDRGYLSMLQWAAVCGKVGPPVQSR